MSFQRKIAVTVALVVATGLCVAGSSLRGQPPERVVDQRLLDMEACIATLEERIAELESQVDLLTPFAFQARGNAALAPAIRPQAPPGAVPFQFNGRTYYYMPLSYTP